MKRLQFLLLGLFLFTSCAKEPATQPANPAGTPSGAASPLANPNTAATPLAAATPTPESLVATAMNDTAWQNDFKALAPFVARLVKTGIRPDRIITDQTVHWTVTFSKYVPGSSDPQAFSSHPLIHFTESAAAAKAKPWVQVVALGKDSESEKLKELKAGQKIKLRCAITGMTVSGRATKQGQAIEGVVLSAEDCVIE